jgi:hypothetical protein
MVKGLLVKLVKGLLVKLVNGQTGQLVNWSMVYGQTGLRSMVYRANYPCLLSKSLPNRSKLAYLTGKKEPCRLSGDSRQGGQFRRLYLPIGESSPAVP